MSLIQCDHSPCLSALQIHALHEAHNAIEAFILHLRGAPSHAKHGRLVDRATLEPWVDNLENWLYSEEADTASLQGTWRCVCLSVVLCHACSPLLTCGWMLCGHRL